MKNRKPKASEPSLRDKLSTDYLQAFQSDFETNGVEVIQQLREKSPEKYAEIAARLIAATEPKSNDDYNQCESQFDIGRKLLQSIGFADPDDSSVEEAVKAHDSFIEQLKAIYYGRVQ